MKFLAAALQIIRSSERPLTTREITERALGEGLIVTRGETPIATMSAALYRALRTDDNLVKLDDQGSVRAKPGSVRWTMRHR